MPLPESTHHGLSETERRDIIKLIDIFGNDTMPLVPVNVARAFTEISSTRNRQRGGR